MDGPRYLSVADLVLLTQGLSRVTPWTALDGHLFRGIFFCAIGLTIRGGAPKNYLKRVMDVNRVVSYD